MIDVKYSIAVIAVVTVLTFFTRAFPFFIFGSREPSENILYIGKHLPYAVIAILVVYCLGGNEINFCEILPKIIAGAVVVAVHLWKRNNLLSIGAGTVVYMVLVQTVFI